MGRLVFLGVVFAATLGAQDWGAEVEKMLHEFMACKSPIDDKSPCNVFVSRALARVYGIHDFESANNGTGHLSANQIADKLAAPGSNWTKLGNAGDQAVLEQAQGYANLKKAVIAVYKGEGHGHVAIILPGKSVASSAWALKVPNSASFPLDEPQKAYIGKPLSNAFGASKKSVVLIYGRNF